MPHLINMTPHTVQLRGLDNNGNAVVVSIPPSGELARIETYDHGIVQIFKNITVNTGIENDKLPIPNAHIPVRAIQYKRLIIPKPRNGTIYIVSRIVAKYAAERGRIDCLFPGPAINGIKELRDGLLKTI